MNTCIFMGNLTADPELKEVTIGGEATSVLNFTVAVNRRNKNGDKDAVFPRCEAWGTSAVNIAKFLKKGDPLIVHTEYMTKPKDANDPTNYEKYHTFKVDRFEFVPRRNKTENDAASPEAPDAGEAPAEAPDAGEAPKGRTKAAKAAKPAMAAATADDDIPF